MRVVIALSLLAIGCDGPTATEPPPSAPARSYAHVATAAPMRVDLAGQLVSRAGQTALLFRVTNESDRALLVDLRDVGRVVRATEAALRMPLSEAQVAELSLVSALSELRPGRALTYAAPFAGCEGTATVALGGVLVALDGDRVVELVADGAQGEVSCAPQSMPAGTRWVAETAALSAGARDPDAFGADLPPLVRAASVSDGADVSLLAFSYDPQPIERWRYDACVAAGTCPVRTIGQPPGSIRRAAVGMSSAGVDAFCASRGLRAPSEEEASVIAAPERALITTSDGLVSSGFRCARTELP